MQELEKILEEIEEIGNIQFASYTKPLIAVEDVIKIIRKHMNDGWIPIEEPPKTNGTYNVTRHIEEHFISDTAYFDGQNTWHNDNRVNHSRSYLTDVIAWHPLPEPYRPEKGDNDGDNNL